MTMKRNATVVCPRGEREEKETIALQLDEKIVIRKTTVFVYSNRKELAVGIYGIEREELDSHKRKE